MKHYNNCDEIGKREITTWLEHALTKVSMREFSEDDLSSMTSIERLYLYSEIVMRYGVFITAEQIRGCVFASKTTLTECILQSVTSANPK